MDTNAAPQKLATGTVGLVSLPVYCYSEGDYSVSIQGLEEILSKLDAGEEVQLFWSPKLVQLLSSKGIISKEPRPYTAMYSLASRERLQQFIGELFEMKYAE